MVIDEVNTRPFFASGFVGNGERVVGLVHQLAREYWFYETSFPLSHIGYYFLEPWWLRRLAGLPVVTVSESTRADLERLGFGRVFVVGEGLGFKPLAELPMKEAFPVVVFVGRLVRAKRPDHALRAFGRVRERFPGAELWVVGDGYFRKELEGMGVGGVRFFGGLGDVERRELVKRAWVLVHSGVREGWGLNVVEANALGVPCVAYDVAGLRDSVRDGVTGLLAESGDVGDLAEKVVAVLGDEGLRVRLSLNALEYSRGFSWDKTAQEFMKIIEGVINER
jgi:glycosyltransferase involved in cell wall biosynthesis